MRGVGRDPIRAEGILCRYRNRYGVNDLLSDILQGRQLKRSGLAGRGYINKAALLYTGLLEAQRRISAEMTRRFQAGAA
jgi:hypothetical protein